MYRAQTFKLQRSAWLSRSAVSGKEAQCLPVVVVDAFTTCVITQFFHYKVIVATPLAAV